MRNMIVYEFYYLFLVDFIVIDRVTFMAYI